MVGETACCSFGILLKANAVRKLIEFLAKYNYWLLFVVLEVASIFLLFRFSGYAGSVWFTSANTCAGALLEWDASVHAYMQLGEANRTLTRRNVWLEERVNALEHELTRMQQLSNAGHTRVDSLLAGSELLDAQVVNNSLRRQDNYITINRGARDGVRPEMGVVCGTGIVGIVSQTGPRYSVVMPILNSHSSISCRLRRTGHFGYLSWDGGNPLLAWMYDVPRHAQVRPGDIVETSGFSSVFPEGIFVGRVLEVHNSSDGLSYSLRIHLGTDFGKLHDVCVVMSQAHEEIDTLEQRTLKLME